MIDAHIISRSVGHTEVTVGTRGSTWVLKAAGMETAVREVLTRPRRPEKMRRALREAVQMGMPVPLSLGPGPGTHWPRPWVCGSSRGKPDRQPDWVLSGTQTTSSDSPPSSLGLWFGGVGEVGEGFRDVQLGNLDQSMKTLWFILMKLTSSHWISALGYVGFKGKHWLLLLGD